MSSPFRTPAFNKEIEKSLADLFHKGSETSARMAPFSALAHTARGIYGRPNADRLSG